MKHILLYNQRSRPLVVRRENADNTWSIYFYTTSGVAPWWWGERIQWTHDAYTSIQSGVASGGEERMQLTHEAYTSIQPDELPSGGQERECRYHMKHILLYNQMSCPLVVRRENADTTWSIYFFTTRRVAPWWSGEIMQLQHMTHRLLYNQRSHPLVVPPCLSAADRAFSCSTFRDNVGMPAVANLSWMRWFKLSQLANRGCIHWVRHQSSGHCRHTDIGTFLIVYSSIPHNL